MGGAGVGGTISLGDIVVSLTTGIKECFTKPRCRVVKTLVNGHNDVLTLWINERRGVHFYPWSELDGNYWSVGDPKYRRIIKERDALFLEIDNSGRGIHYLQFNPARGGIYEPAQ